MLKLPKNKEAMLELFNNTNSDLVKIMLLSYSYCNLDDTYAKNNYILTHISAYEYKRIRVILDSLGRYNYYNDCVNDRGHIIVNKFFKKVLHEYNLDNNFDLYQYLEDINNKYLSEVSENHNLDFLKNSEQLINVLNDIIDANYNHVIDINGLHVDLRYITIFVKRVKSSNIFKFKLSKKRCIFGELGFYTLEFPYKLKGKNKYAHLKMYTRDYKLMQIAHI